MLEFRTIYRELGTEEELDCRPTQCWIVIRLCDPPPSLPCFSSDSVNSSSLSNCSSFIPHFRASHPTKWFLIPHSIGSQHSSTTPPSHNLLLLIPDNWFLISRSLASHPPQLLIPIFLAYYPIQLYLILTLLLLCRTYQTLLILIPLIGSSSHSLVPHPHTHLLLIFIYCSSSHTHCFSFHHASLLRIFHIPFLVLLIPRSYSLSYTCCSASLTLLLLIPSCLALHQIFSLPSSLTL